MATLQIRAKSAYGRNLLICLALLLLSFIAIKVLGLIGAGLLLMVPVAVGTLFYLSFFDGFVKCFGYLDSSLCICI